MRRTKAEKREKKKRKKMAVHGRGIKSQPCCGIPKAAKRRVCVLAFLCFCFIPAFALAQSEPPPRLFIVSPAPGEVILADEVKVIVDISEEFTLANPQEHPEHINGMGHLRIWLDPVRGRASEEARAVVQGRPASNGVDPPETHDKETSVALTKESEYTYKNVFPGLHTVYAEFFRNDNKPYEPRLAALVDFETITEEIKPAPGADENNIDQSQISGGLFLPPGQGNTILVTILIALGIIVLWYIFKYPRKKHD